ncbi:MAG: AAA family ATPase [Rhodospirillaceae bacterium]
MARADMIDLVGRAAQRLNLNEKPHTPEAAPPRRGADNPRLEPTILASLATEEPAGRPAADSPAVLGDEPLAARASLMDSFADAQVAREAAAREDVARSTDANTIAIDWTKLAKAGYLTPNTQNSQKAEEFRVIKRPLLRTAFGTEATRLAHGYTQGMHHRSGESNAHVIMVTSPGPGDGKTFNAINLAVSIASERDLQVLLIDADIRSRGLSRVLGVADRPGLMEVLTQSQPSAESVVLHTDMPSLSVIAAGSPMPGAAEMLASQAMTRLVHDIATRYKNRFVIFDAPPALATSEPGVLAGHVGQVVMVVRANETSRRAIVDAVALVNTCPTVNFILNQMSRPQRFSYYGEPAAEAHA